MGDKVLYCLYDLLFEPLRWRVLAIAEMTPYTALMLNERITDHFKRWYPAQPDLGADYGGV